MKPRMARMVADYWSAAADRTAGMIDDWQGKRHDGEGLLACQEATYCLIMFGNPVRAERR